MWGGGIGREVEWLFQVIGKLLTHFGLNLMIGCRQSVFEYVLRNRPANTSQQDITSQQGAFLAALSNLLKMEDSFGRLWEELGQLVKRRFVASRSGMGMKRYE